MYLIRHKSEAKSHLSAFCALVATQYHSRIKIVQTDNSISHSSTDLEKIFLIKGDRIDNGYEFLSNDIQFFFQVKWEHSST